MTDDNVNFLMGVSRNPQVEKMFLDKNKEAFDKFFTKVLEPKGFEKLESMLFLAGYNRGDDKYWCQFI